MTRLFEECVVAVEDETEDDDETTKESYKKLRTRMVLIGTIVLICNTKHRIQRWGQPSLRIEQPKDENDETENDASTGKTDNDHEMEDDETKSHCVRDIFIELDYRNQGFGKLLLLYSILRVKQIHPHIHWIILDDMSARSGYASNNLYCKFGFRGQPTQDMSGSGIVFDGPERELSIHHKSVFFSKTVKTILTEIAKNLKSKKKCYYLVRTNETNAIIDGKAEKDGDGDGDGDSDGDGNGAGSEIDKEDNSESNVDTEDGPITVILKVFAFAFFSVLVVFACFLAIDVFSTTKYWCLVARTLQQTIN